MKRIILAFIFIAFLSSSCGDDEKIIDNSNSSGTLLVSVNSPSPELLTIDIDDGSIVDRNIYQEANDRPLQAEVTRIYEFRGLLFLLMPMKNKIEVIDFLNFEKQGEIDFASSGLRPNEMTFPNATDAYVIFKNSNIVRAVDLTTYEPVNTIQVGHTPKSIVSIGNQVVVANQLDNTVSFIDTRTNQEETAVLVKSAPTFVDVCANKTDILVISLGQGKIDTTHEKTAAFASFIDINSKQTISEIELSMNYLDPTGEMPYGLTISPDDWAFLLSNDKLIRIDTRSRQHAVIAKYESFSSINTNAKTNSLLLFKKENNQDKLLLANLTTAEVFSEIPLPTGFITLHVLN